MWEAPCTSPTAGDGSLRVLIFRPIITADGYPIPTMGKANIATEVATENEARETVRKLIDGAKD